MRSAGRCWASKVGKPFGLTSLALSVVALSLAAFSPAAAQAFPGQLTYTACNGDYTPQFGTPPCVGTTPADAVFYPRQLAISPDGDNVYVTSVNSNSVDVFTRNSATGTLTYDDCIGDLNGCTATTPAGALDGAEKIVISPDGSDVYVASNSGDNSSNGPSTISEFARGVGGALTFVGCFGARAGCTAIDNSSFGVIDDPEDMAFSPDGKYLYIADYSLGLIVLTRNTSTGALAFNSCVSAAPATGGGCAVATTPEYSMSELRAVTVSPDGANVYVGADGPAEVIDEFSRSATTGTASSIGCIGDPANSYPGCTVPSIPLAGQSAYALTMSPDSNTLYSGGDEDNVAWFSRGPTGLLTLGGCVGADTVNACAPTVPAGALDGVYSLALSPDDDDLYTASTGNGAVGELSVTNPGGALTYDGCAGETYQCDTTNVGFEVTQSPWSLAVSPDGLNVYASAETSDAVDEFSSAALQISEVRLTGDDPDDVYVDLYNPSSVPVSISGWTLRYTTASGYQGTDPLADANLAGGEIPAGGHYLLADYPGPYSLYPYALPDQALGVPSGSGGLVGVSLTSPQGAVSDSVGYTGSTYVSGTGLTEPVFDSDTSETAFVRRYYEGLPVDSGNNAADFEFIAPDALSYSYGVGAVFGSPDPLTSTSPAQVNGIAQSYLLDPAVGEGVAPNLNYQPPVSGLPSVSNPGTLTVDRTITNVSTSSTITRLQIRITSLSSSGALLADVSSASGTADGEPIAATTLSSPAGGLNSTLSVALPAQSADPAAVGLSPGQSVNVAITFDVFQTGSFSFGYNVEDDLVPYVGAVPQPPSTVSTTSGTSVTPAGVTPPAATSLSGSVTSGGVTVSAAPVMALTSPKRSVHRKARKKHREHRRHKRRRRVAHPKP